LGVTKVIDLIKIIIILNSFVALHAQFDRPYIVGQRIDAYQSLLKKQLFIDDSKTIKLLKEIHSISPSEQIANSNLGRYYLDNDSLKLAEYYLIKAVKYGFSWLPYNYINLARLHFKKGDLDSGFYYWEEAQKREPSNYKHYLPHDENYNLIHKDIYDSLINKYYTKEDQTFLQFLDSANTEQKNANHKNAINLYYTTIELDQKTPYFSEYMESYIFSVISRIYADIGEYDKAIKNLIPTLKHYENVESLPHLDYVYSRLSFYSRKMDLYDDEIFWQQKLILNNLKLKKEDYYIAENYKDLGKKYYWRGRVEQAIQCYINAIEFSMTEYSKDYDMINSKNSTIIDIYLDLINCSMEVGDYGATIDYYGKALKYAKEDNNYQIYELYERIIHLYKKLGLDQESLKAFIDYFNYMETEIELFEGNIVAYGNIIVHSDTSLYENYWAVLNEIRSYLIRKYDKSIFELFDSPGYKVYLGARSFIDSIYPLENWAIRFSKSDSTVLGFFVAVDEYWQELHFINDIYIKNGKGYPNIDSFINQTQNISKLDIKNMISNGLGAELNSYLNNTISDEVITDYIFSTTTDSCFKSLRLGVAAALSASTNDINKAIDLYERAMILRKEHCPDKSSDLMTLLEITKLLYITGDMDQIENKILQTIDLIESIRIEAPEKFKADYLDYYLGVYNTLSSIYFSQKKYNKFVQTLEMAKAKILGERLSEQVSDFENILPSIQKLLREDEIILYFSEILFTPDSVFNKTYLSAPGIPDYYCIRITKNNIDVSIISLKNLYSLYPNENNQIGFSEFIISEYNNLLKKPRTKEFESVSKQFFQELFQDLGSIQQNYSDLIIIPSGPLGLLAFETLLDNNQQYLCENFSIKYVQSLNVLQSLSNRHKTKPNTNLIAFGGANYGQNIKKDYINNTVDMNLMRSLVSTAISKGYSMDNMYREIGEGKLNNLPGSLKEVKRISAIMKDNDIYIGSDANEDIIKYLSKTGKLKKYSVIHFATHAKSIPEIPELSSIILSRTIDKSNKEDGYLRIDEIRNLDIEADFVCLSACETGVGKVYFSEGVINFTQAFMEAGSNSVSVTLWPIFDESTSEFMVSMYEKIADGATYSKAINETKRDFISGEYGELYKHPFFWAPYVYYGK